MTKFESFSVSDWREEWTASTFGCRCCSLSYYLTGHELTSAIQETAEYYRDRSLYYERLLVAIANWGEGKVRQALLHHENKEDTNDPTEHTILAFLGKESWT